MHPPAASVVISTYNHPEWLQRCLWGYACQDRRDFELVVADDGSGEETRQLIESMRLQLPFPLRHVWHADDGFRKCTILNRGIEASRADYLIFSDGDCVPRADFVSQHLRLREPGKFLSGGYFKLPITISQRIALDDIASGRCFRHNWLRSHGLSLAPRNVKLSASGWAASLLDATVTTRASWNGHNASGWKSDLVAANGFDERMGYGGEDRELGERLQNRDIRGKRIRHRAICLHLDHERGYVKQEILQANAALRERTRTQKVVVTPYGIRRIDDADKSSQGSARSDQI